MIELVGVSLGVPVGPVLVALGVELGVRVLVRVSVGVGVAVGGRLATTRIAPPLPEVLSGLPVGPYAVGNSMVSACVVSIGASGSTTAWQM